MLRRPLLAATVLATLTAPAGALAARGPNPCVDATIAPGLRCPDLVMARPSGLRADAVTRPGRVLLRAVSSLDNRGRGPAVLRGRRSGRYRMRARQRIAKRGGGAIEVHTGAQLYFKYVTGQTRYWKFAHAAAFALYRLDARGRPVRRVRIGPKAVYCLRDLVRTRPRLLRSPPGPVFPACSTDAAARGVKLGTSVGWSDVYPAGYPEQWIDVTGLRGCFAYTQRADPANGIYESNEANNASSVTVRLPFRAGRQGCPGTRGDRSLGSTAPVGPSY